MKKTKLLIPALSIASVGAVVAPMVTSCAKANGITFQAAKDGEWNKDYTPMEGPTTLTYEDKKSFVDGLTSTINGNQKIWADDVMCNLLENAWEESTTPGVTTMNISVSNGSITNKTIDLSPSEYGLVITSLISFDIKIDTTRVSTTNEDVTNYSTTEYHVSNMPYTFYKSWPGKTKTKTYDIKTPVAVPSLLTLMNGGTGYDQLDIPSYLTFLESGFSLSFATKYWDSKGEVFTDFGFTLDNVETLIRVMSDATIWPMFGEYFMPLQLPIVSNYFVHAKY